MLDWLDRPRLLFGRLQREDVWLLEHSLLTTANLARLACTSPIAVRLSNLGAPQPWVNFCLLVNGYSLNTDFGAVRSVGDYAWSRGDDPVLNIHLRPTTYACTIIGIGRPIEPKEPLLDDTLYLMAWGHDFLRGHTIWECAETLQAAGCRYALVMDEGQDVFQVFNRGQWDESFSQQEISMLCDGLSSAAYSLTSEPLWLS